MRKFFAVCLTLTILCFVVVSRNKFAVASNTQQDLPAVHGKDNPEAIPDYIAQDAFLRSLTARPDDEQGKRRAETFAEDALGIAKGKQKTGEEKTEVEELLAAAKQYVNQVSVMDVQVKEIKDQHFPEPSATVMAELNNLQRRKVAIGQEVLKTFDKSFRVKKESKSKVLRHIAEEVKRGITTVVPEKPGNPKHENHGGMNHGGSGLGMMLATFLPLPVAAQSYMGEGYTYARTSYNLDWLEIYGYGATAESYSSNGHTYKLVIETVLDNGYRVTLNQPNGYSSSPPVSGTNYIPMLINGSYFSGLASTGVNGTGYCPMSYSYPYGMSSSQGQATIFPFLVLGEFGPWSRTTVSPSSDAASIVISVTASRTVSQGYMPNIEFSYETSKPANITTTPIEDDNGSFQINPLQTKALTFRFKHTAVDQPGVDISALARLSTANGTNSPVAVTGTNPRKSATLRLIQ